MKIKQNLQLGGFVICCILINCLGKHITSLVDLPLWLDSIGTVLAAYVLGPFCGAVVGVSVNIIFGFFEVTHYFYAVSSIAIAVMVGIGAQKGMFSSRFRMVSVCFLVTLVTTFIATPLNFWLFDGNIGSMWGDGIVEMLRAFGMNRIVANVIGQFFLEFLDKFVTLFIIYYVIKLRNKQSNKHTALFVFAVVVSAMAMPCNTFAKNVTDNYNTYIQTIYGSENGLLSGAANDVASSKNGVLWIGTYAGLYRYNGTQFQYENNFDTVKNVNCLYVDEEGRMWIGTNDGGVSICNDEEIVNVITEKEGLPTNSVRSIVQQSSGKYYVGTSGALAVVSLAGGVQTCGVLPEIMYAKSLSADEENHVAAVTMSGELFLVEEDEIVAQVQAKEEDDAFSCCCFDEAGFLYTGMSSGRIYQYEIVGKKLVLRNSYFCELSAINSLKETANGELFICAEKGIAYFDKNKKLQEINSGNFCHSIEHMEVDYQGNLWFASSRTGIMKMCSSAFTELYSEIGLEETVVNAITKWNDRMYVGTDTGLDIIDTSNMTSKSDELTRMLGNTRIRFVYTDSHNNLWICTYGQGVIRADSKMHTTTFDSEKGLEGNKFRCCLELKDGTIAISSDAGLCFIKGDTVQSILGVDEGLDNTIILSMVQMEDGTILASTDGGGIAVVKDGKVINMLKKKDGLSSDVILRLVKDEDANGFFAVASNGLNYIEVKEDNLAIRTLDNFPYSNNYDIYDDGNGKLFVTGSAGIYVVKKDSLLAGEEVEYELLNALNGLRGTLIANSWNYVDTDRQWYIANGSGITKLNLREYQDKNKSYRMLLQKIEIDGVAHKVERHEAIELSKGSAKIQLYPEIINYSTRDPYISYYMEGLELDRTVVRQSELSEIIYANIPSGQYKFHLAVLDEKSGNVLEENIYEIVKEKEIYDNWWFKAYFLAELIFIIAWISWFITRMFLQRTLNLQKREIELAKEQIKLGNETILAIARTVDAKDSNTSQHSTRVSEYSVMIAERLGYTEEEQETLRKAALLHDIGKIGIPDRVLNKAGRLTDEEYAVMKSHVSVGGEILKDFTLIDNVDAGAMYHHERWDGTGYMKGLKGEEIPEMARIIGIADAFDAMTANRVYRKKLDIDTVVEEIKKGRGTQFDPNMADIMLSLIEEGEIDVDALYGEEPEYEK